MPWLGDGPGTLGSALPAGDDTKFGAVSLTGSDAMTQLLQITLDLCAQLLGGTAEPSSGVYASNRLFLFFCFWLVPLINFNFILIIS